MNNDEVKLIDFLLDDLKDNNDVDGTISLIRNKAKEIGTTEEKVVFLLAHKAAEYGEENGMNAVDAYPLCAKELLEMM